MTAPADTVHQAQLLGELIGCEITDAVRLNTESRNAVLRTRLADGRNAILKYYAPESDRQHWANRFRREEKVLTLLAKSEPPLAPRPLGGFIAAKGPAALLMEDAGKECLADVLLESAGEAEWIRMADFVMDLHAGLAYHRAALKRTAFSISLDRINSQVLLSRFRIASRRLLGDTATGAVEREYRMLLSPVVTDTKGMIHNSLSPLNVVIGANGWRAIDWETLTWASPLWDWAEFLRSPYNPMPFEMAEALVAAAREGERPTRRVYEKWQRRMGKINPSESLFHRAVLSRHLDSLATVHLRRLEYRKQGKLDREAEYARRMHFYAEDLVTVVECLEPPKGLETWLGRIIDSARS